MEISKFIKRLMFEEGLVLRSYQDTKEQRAIGFGTSLNKSDVKSYLVGQGYDLNRIMAGTEKIAVKDALHLLEQDVAVTLQDSKAVINNFAELSETRQLVVMDMSYNLGLPRFNKFENFAQALQDNQWEKAAAEIKDSRYWRAKHPSTGKVFARREENRVAMKNDRLEIPEIFTKLSLKAHQSDIEKFLEKMDSKYQNSSKNNIAPKSKSAAEKFEMENGGASVDRSPWSQIKTKEAAPVCEAELEVDLKVELQQEQDACMTPKPR